MIKVNLAGTGRTHTATDSARLAKPAKLTPVVLILIVLASAAGGYWWYSSVSGQIEDLDSRIAQAEAERIELEEIIQQDQVYEARKAALENRIRVIENLSRNQVSPVISLDVLADALDRTEYVWLSSLEQDNAVFRMTGTSTSLNAIADFITYLNNTRYFRTVDLQNAQDAQGNFTFSMACEFSPPANQGETAQAARGEVSDGNRS